MASPYFLINGSDPRLGAVAVAAGAAITATLVSTDGVSRTDWTMRRADDLTDPATAYVLVTAGAVQQTCTTTALLAGTAGALEATINNGVDPATGDPSAAMTFVGKFYVASGGGLMVAVSGEQEDGNLESHPVAGVCKIINDLIRPHVGLFTSIIFDVSALNPQIYQATDTAVVVGDTLTIHAQDVNGAAGTGGGLTLRPGHGDTHGALSLQDASATTKVQITATGVVDFAGTSITATGNPTWDLGTNTVDVDVLRFGASPGASGAIRLTDTNNATWLNGGNTYALWSGQGTHAYVGGAYPTKPTNIYVDASSVVGLTAGSQNMVLSTYLLFNFANVAFGATTGAPVLNQNDRTAAGGSGYTYTVRAQHATDVSVANTGGALALQGGNAAGPAASAGGAVQVTGGNATAAGVGSVGGAVSITGGTGETGGDVIIAPGHGATHGQARLRDASAADRIVIEANGQIILDGPPGGSTHLKINGAYVTEFNTTQLLMRQGAPNISFMGSCVAPLINQADDSTAGVTGDTFTVRAQHVTDAAVANTGGTLALAGGNAAGAVASHGGNVTITAGNASAAGVGSTGGDVRVYLGHGETHGDFRVLDGDGASVRINANSAGDVGMNGATYGYIQIAGNTRLLMNGTYAQFSVPSVFFVNTTVSPTIYQDDDAGGGVTGDTLTIRAQNATGGAGTTGGMLLLQPGHGITHGTFRVQDADGATSRIEVDSSGNVAINPASYTQLKVAGTVQFTVANTYVEMGASTPTFQWVSGASSPLFTQSQDSTASVTGDDMTIAAQSVSEAAGGASTATAGDLGLRGGQGLGHADNKDGNIWLHVAPGNWQTMEKGVFVADCVTAPTGNPASGGFMYSEAGAGKWRGSGGTVTTFGAAGPHCPACGYDHPKVAVCNERFGSYMFECGMCGHIEKNGPQDVLGILTDDEKLDLLKPGDHVHNMRVLAGKHRGALPRKRSHEPMVESYKADCVRAVTEAPHDEAALDALAEVRLAWADKWQAWVASCDASEKGSADAVPAMVAAADDALEALALARPTKAEVDAAEAASHAAIGTLAQESEARQQAIVDAEAERAEVEAVRAEAERLASEQLAAEQAAAEQAAAEQAAAKETPLEGGEPAGDTEPIIP